MAERGLGRGPGAGLSAIFGGDSIADDEIVVNLPIVKVEPRQDQPRTQFDDEALEELAESLKRYGLIQPITARKLPSGYYQIIAGERRWRAARIAGLEQVPVRVIEADEKLATELALVENLQREDLNPIEEARGYRTLMQEYGLTQEETAQSVGKSRPAIANSLRLLSLDESILKMIEDGILSAGHARAILQIKDLPTQIETAARVVRDGLSVRQTETLAARLSKALKQIPHEDEKEEEEEVNYIAEVEKNLSSLLGRKVSIDYKNTKGRVMLEFYGNDDLEQLIQTLKISGRPRV